MKNKMINIKLIFLCSFMLLMILDSKTALISTSKALELCIKTIIPGVFPLLFLSSAISSEMHNFTVPILERILHIPKGTSGYFLIGLLCGYPVGGKLLQDGINKKTISKDAACRMMAFCNNASPAFIIGILAPIFSSGLLAIVMWIIQTCSSTLLGMLLPKSKMDSICHEYIANKNIGQVMWESIKAVATICGWVIMFGIVVAYLDAPVIGRLSTIPRILISGSLELTNGIIGVGSVASASIAFTISAILLSFGGTCVILQTKSVAPDLKILPYIRARMIHAGISGSLASIFSTFLFQSPTDTLKIVPLFLCLVFTGILILHFNKKEVAININM